VANVDKYNFSGVNIDLEGIPAYGRQSYTDFLRELGAVLREKNKLLTVAIPAKTYDNAKDHWSGAYDYKAIGKLADYVVIMSYDEHWFGGAPGPVASLPWVTKVIEYGVNTIPRSKILMGIGCYGYDWPASGQGKAITWKAMDGLVKMYGNVLWDDNNSVPHLVYWKGGKKHNVWYENSYSLAIKLKLVNSYNIGGIAIWRLGYEDQSFWETVSKQLK
jgi:spore germination protein YaaH